MKRTTLISVLSVSSCFIVTPPSFADVDARSDWPQWRGPERTGLSTEAGWNPTAPDVSLWTKKIGFGHSSFAVADGRLFAMGYDADRELDVVFCLNPITGEERWTHAYPAERWNEGHDGGTCTTPTVVGDTVYTSNREGKLFSLRADTGSVKWEHDMQAELGVMPPRWGFAGSPVVIDDLVVANVGKLAAYDASSGAHRWITEKEYGNAYSTPIEHDFRGRPSVLVLNGLGLAAIDRADGSEIAFYPWTRNPELAVYGATPVIIDDRIFISASSGGGCVMLRPNEANEFEVIWESRVMGNDQAGCVLYDDHLYGFDSSILKCIDLDGNEKWRERGIGLGAMMVVGGRLLVVGAKGEVIVAEATPERYVELSRTRLLEGGAYWSTPVLSHGIVYARNSLGDMVARDHRTRAVESEQPSETPDVLPPAASLLAGHVEAIGGADAVRGLESVFLDGAGERHGAGPIERCDAELSWSVDDAFVWRFSSGLDFGYAAGAGWAMTQGGPQMLDEDRIARMRQVGDLRRVLAENWGFATVETVSSRVFDDRPCFVVAAETEDGLTRTLYFEIETGLLAGQEGDDVSLWTFGDYAPVGGVLLPMEWSFFDPQRGAMTRATFDSVVTNADRPDRFEPPLLIRMMSRTPEEKEAANESLRLAYGDLVGDYTLATGSMVGTPIAISIGDGGLRMSFAGQPPQFLSEPDDEDRLFVMSQPQIYLTAKRASPDEAYTIDAHAYGAEFGRLQRAGGD